MATQKEVIIVGGGVSGLGMAIQLQRLLGHNNFTLYEKSDNIGGTWWHNRYPACACDIPSHFYSYSFALKPDWSSMYPGRDELHNCKSKSSEYFQKTELGFDMVVDLFSVAEKYNIISRCRFNTMCKSMIWDQNRQLWTCTLEDIVTGRTFIHEAPVVISAIGTLDRPYIPSIEGAAQFQGTIFHSARWDKSVDFKNKNVVVLGNGASATQFVPELIKEVSPHGSVTQIVRSAHWWTKRVSQSSHLIMLQDGNLIPILGQSGIFRAVEVDNEICSFCGQTLSRLLGLGTGESFFLIPHDFKWVTHEEQDQGGDHTVY